MAVHGRLRPALRTLLAAASLGVTVAPAAASDVEATAALTLASDYVFRGVSQTDGDPAVQARLGLEHASGWFGGLLASTVDLPGGPYERNRDVVLAVHLGYGREVAPGWTALATAVHYAYPDGGGHYDYQELGVGLEYAGVRGSVAFTDDALGFRGRGRVWELVARRELPRGFTLDAGAGSYELEGRDDDYAFYHAAVARSFRRFAADLGYFGSSGSGKRAFGRRADGRVVVGLSFRLR